MGARSSPGNPCRGARAIKSKQARSILENQEREREIPCPEVGSFTMANRAEPIWSRTFLFLCSTQLLGYSHNALLTPTLPLYITHLGGSAFIVGLTLAAFSVTSMLIRPAIGY